MKQGRLSALQLDIISIISLIMCAHRFIGSPFICRESYVKDKWDGQSRQRRACAVFRLCGHVRQSEAIFRSQPVGRIP